MKFMTTWSGSPTHFKASVARFLETGGGPPEGVTMLGRWHGPNSGFCLAKATDLKGIYEWLAQWSDLLDFTVTPVMEDTEAAEVFKKLGS